MTVVRFVILLIVYLNDVNVCSAETGVFDLDQDIIGCSNLGFGHSD